MDKEIRNKILTGVAVIALVIGSLWVAWSLTTVPANQAQDKAVEISVTDVDHIKGNAEAAVTLVEFSDFQCPACRAFAPLASQIVEEYGEDIAFVYKHFPLSQHENAEPAALAAEAAGAQDKFFEMHDLLFDRQEDWEDLDDPFDTFVEYANELELDIEQFTEVYNADETKKKVQADLLEGTQAGVNSTPTFYLNGQKLRNPGSYDEFANMIQLAIEESATSDSTDEESTDSADTETEATDESEMGEEDGA